MSIKDERMNERKKDPIIDSTRKIEKELGKYLNNLGHFVVKLAVGVNEVVPPSLSEFEKNKERQDVRRRGTNYRFEKRFS